MSPLMIVILRFTRGGALLAAGAVVLGVSADDEKSHKAFAQKYELPFPILADPDKTIISAYGVKMPLIGIAKRVTFLIDKQGVIRFKQIGPVTVEALEKKILPLVRELQKS